MICLYKIKVEDEYSNITICKAKRKTRQAQITQVQIPPKEDIEKEKKEHSTMPPLKKRDSLLQTPVIQINYDSNR
jgi:ribosome-binding protein aMBF1 (putative translation factor)